MHKVRSFARSKAHAHGYNPWSSDAGQQATGTVEQTPNQAAVSGSISIPSADANDLQNAISASERRRGSVDSRRQVVTSKRSTIQPSEPPTVSTIDPLNSDRAVHFTAANGSNNTQNIGEPPDNPQERKKPSVLKRFYATSRQILLHSWINVLLVFVPIGIAVHLAGLDPVIVFAMNCIALIPLAALLSYATESVAHRLGDTIGALMNVTFGNAVELIVL